MNVQQYTTETPKFWNLFPLPVTNQKVTARLYKKNGHNKAKEEQIKASYGT